MAKAIRITRNKATRVKRTSNGARPLNVSRGLPEGRTVSVTVKLAPSVVEMAQAEADAQGISRATMLAGIITEHFAVVGE